MGYSATPRRLRGIPGIAADPVHGAATRPARGKRSAESARWWVIGGALVVGIATFLGVAQWQPK
jgi:hypothetical protein